MSQTVIHRVNHEGFKTYIAHKKAHVPHVYRLIKIRIFKTQSKNHKYFNWDYKSISENRPMTQNLA